MKKESEISFLTDKIKEKLSREGLNVPVEEFLTTLKSCSLNNKYALWMLKTYLNDGIQRYEDFSRVKFALELIIKHKNSIPVEKRDINKLKNITELEDLVEPFIEKKTENDLKKEEYEKILKETIVIRDDDEAKIIIPKTEDASIFWGQGTKWCTASTNSRNYFNDYNKRGNLYIVIDKKTGKKTQISFQERQIMDELDQNVKLPDLIRAKDVLLTDYMFIDFGKNENNLDKAFLPLFEEDSPKSIMNYFYNFFARNDPKHIFSLTSKGIDYIVDYVSTKIKDPYFCVYGPDLTGFMRQKEFRDKIRKLDEKFYLYLYATMLADKFLKNKQDDYNKIFENFDKNFDVHHSNLAKYIFLANININPNQYRKAICDYYLETDQLSELFELPKFINISGLVSSDHDNDFFDKLSIIIKNSENNIPLHEMDRFCTFHKDPKNDILNSEKFYDIINKYCETKNRNGKPNLSVFIILFEKDDIFSNKIIKNIDNIKKIKDPEYRLKLFFDYAVKNCKGEEWIIKNTDLFDKILGLADEYPLRFMELIMSKQPRKYEKYKNRDINNYESEIQFNFILKFMRNNPRYTGIFEKIDYDFFMMGHIGCTFGEEDKWLLENLKKIKYYLSIKTDFIYPNIHKKMRDILGHRYYSFTLDYSDISKIDNFSSKKDFVRKKIRDPEFLWQISEDEDFNICFDPEGKIDFYSLLISRKKVLDPIFDEEKIEFNVPKVFDFTKIHQCKTEQIENTEIVEETKINKHEKKVSFFSGLFKNFF